MKTICLNMIVKNEEAVIERALSSVKEIIDYWCIVDTGSTDRTKEIILEALDGIPGELVESEWVNFGHNRTEAIQLAEGKADYILLMDADMIAVYKDSSFKEDLTEDSYYIHYVGDVDYVQKMFVKSGFDWHYIGVTHEYIHGKPHKAKESDFLKLRHFADGGSRSDKLTRDVALLEETLDEDPHNPRTAFYLAQSYYGLGKYDEAMVWYKTRITMGGWWEETWYAMYQMAKCSEHMGKSFPVVQSLYLDAYDFCTERAEPLYYLAKLCRLKKKWGLAELYARRACTIQYPDTAMLFVEKTVYEWQAIDELAISIWYNGKYEESYNLCETLLQNDMVPKKEIDRIVENKSWALKKIAEERKENE